MTFLIVFFLAPQFFSKKQTPSKNLSDFELKTVVAKMRLLHPIESKNLDPTYSIQQKTLKLGNALFFDEDLSDGGKVACATCHQPHASFTDQKPVAVGLAQTSMNAPTIINAYAGAWFFWNGRADSLESQALGPIENSKEHGFSRSKVAALIIKKYRVAYEEIFGKISSDLLALDQLATQHPPSPIDVKSEKSRMLFVSSAVAAYALATINDPDMLKEILKSAQSQGVQPVEILKQRSSGLAAHNSTPTNSLTDYEALTPVQQQAINHLFANVGRAIAAFERTIRTSDSPFDKFVDRYLKSSSDLLFANDPKQALGEKFGESELQGLRLFTGKGNCTLCHQGPYFTDQQFHNIGLATTPTQEINLGRSQGLLLAKTNPYNCLGEYFANENTTSPSESCLEMPYLESESTEAVGAFKTPTLRNLSDTYPYGHDGRFKNIESVLQHYNKLGDRPAVGHTEESLLPLNFTATELKALEAFLLSLNSEVTYYKEDLK